MTWNASVPPYVREYFKKKGLSAGKIVIEKYHECKQNEVPELLKELAKAREHVAQLEQNVAQVKSECDTKWKICDTIFETFVAQNRDIVTPSSQDQFWIKTKLEKKGVKTITADDFIEHYQNKKEAIDDR